MDLRTAYHRYLFHRKTADGLRWSLDPFFSMDNQKRVEPFVHFGSSTGAFVDIGAQTGRWALTGERYYRPGGVHAFEPDPFYFRVLARNVKMNRLSTVTLHNVSLGNGIRGHTFNESQQISPDAKPNQRASTSSNSNVLFKKLDDFEIKPALIRISAKGTELSIIRGGIRMISQYLPKLVVEANTEEDRSNLKNTLGSYSWRQVDSFMVAGFGKVKGFADEVPWDIHD